MGSGFLVLNEQPSNEKRSRRLMSNVQLMKRSNVVLLLNMLVMLNVLSLNVTGSWMAVPIETISPDVVQLLKQMCEKERLLDLRKITGCSEKMFLKIEYLYSVPDSLSI